MSRSETFYSLGLMPALTGLSHLVPPIGAIQTVTGSYQFPGRLFGLIGAITVIVDSFDKYKDLPLSSRPSKWIWRIWIYGLWAIVLACTVLSDLQTAIDIYQVLPLGLLWGAPCIPQFSTTNGLALIKPKTMFMEAKSLVVAFGMASVGAESCMNYYCRQSESPCSDRGIRLRCFCLVVLYQFFRETSCDTRDMAEDAKEGLQTLPVRLGKRNTMMLMTVVGLLLDSILTQSVIFTTSGIILRFPQLAHAVLRVGLTMAAYWQILKYPRNNCWAWGPVAFLGLVPVLFAQAALLS